MLLTGVVVLSVHCVVRATHSVNGGNALFISDGSGAPPITATLTEQEQQLINAGLLQINGEFDPSVDPSEFDFNFDPFSQGLQPNQQPANHVHSEFENGNLPRNEQSVIPDSSKQENVPQPATHSVSDVNAFCTKLCAEIDAALADLPFKFEPIKVDSPHVNDPATQPTVDDPIAHFLNSNEPSLNFLNSDSHTHPNAVTDHDSSPNRKQKREKLNDESDDGEDDSSDQQDEQLHHYDMTGELWRDNLEYLLRKHPNQITNKERLLLATGWKFVARMLDAEEPLNSFNAHTLQFSRSQLSQQLGFKNYYDLFTHDFPPQWSKESCRLHLGSPHTWNWISFFGRDWSDDQAEIEPDRPKNGVYSYDHFETGKDVRDVIYNVFEQPWTDQYGNKRQKYWNIIRRMLEKGWTKFTPQRLNMDYQTFLDKLEIETFTKLDKELSEKGLKKFKKPFEVGSKQWYDFLGVNPAAQ